MKALWRFVSCALLAVALSGCLGSGGGGSGSTTPQPPSAPGPAYRADLLHAYYGDWTGQNDETADHVNAMWVWGWPARPGEDVTTLRLEEADRLGVHNVVVGLPESFQPQAEAQIRARLDKWRALGLLDLVYAFTPVDEPDGHGNASGDMLRAWASMMRDRVIPDYPEIRHVKLAVIYSPAGRPAIDVFDLAGWDDYSSGYGVLGEAFDQFKALLRPDQGIILIPGGADGVGRIDPEPFFAKAQLDSQVRMVVSFLWFDNWDREFSGTQKGIRSNGMAQAYCLMGKKIKNPRELNPTCPQHQ